MVVMTAALLVMTLVAEWVLKLGQLTAEQLDYCSVASLASMMVDYSANMQVELLVERLELNLDWLLALQVVFG